MNNLTSIKQIMLIITTAVSASLVSYATTADKIDNMVKNTSVQPLEEFKKNGKWGFKSNGKVVILPKYD